MALVAIGVISKDNKPLAIRTKYDYAEEPGRHDAEKLKLMFLMNSSLDFVDEKQNTTNHRDSYLGLLCHLETYKVYALLTTTKTKILLILTTQSSSHLRDNDVKHLLKNVQAIYMEATASNPFHVTGSPIHSQRFDNRIRSILQPPEHVMTQPY